jgi:glycerol-3-phosphate dehydrogenase subunit B
MDSDILIIGGGMAGLIAGTKAAEEGASVTVIRKGEGATSDSSGAIDILGYLPGAKIPFLSPIEALNAVTRLMPFHPYTVLSRSTDGPASSEYLIERMSQSVGFLRSLFEGAKIRFFGGLEENLALLTVLGTTKPSALVQDTMVSNHLIDDTSVILFVGINGLQDFNSRASARTYLEHQMGSQSGAQKVAQISLDLAPFGKPYNIAMMDAARYIETDEGFESLKDALSKEVSRVGATHIAMAPMLGIRNTREIRDALEKETGASVFELLSFPPSVPGYRLSRSLEMAFKRAGGTLLVGHEAVGYQRNGVISSVTAKSPRRTLELTAKAFILATGKFLGGGIHGSEKGLRESLFGLPVVDADRNLLDREKPVHLTNITAISPDGHPLFAAGVAYDHLLRPLDSSGAIFAENLFSAGGILSGHNYPVEKSGLGVALLSGHSAGGKAAEYVEDA